jgi:hypothetical protein
MTSNLKHAFALAAVAFLKWHQSNEEIRVLGIYFINSEPAYYAEPTVQFFGRQLPISKICEYAAVLRGPLSDIDKGIFDVICEIYGAGDEVRTYDNDGAVDLLQMSVYEELADQKRNPLPRPSLADTIRMAERVRVWGALEQLIKARPDRPCIELLQHRPGKLLAALVMADRGQP